MSVAASADDAKETISGGAVVINETAISASSTFMPAFRFLNITIPPAATIVSASIQFTAGAGTQSSAVTVNIVGEAADNAATFTTATSSISSRARTTAPALISWAIPTFNTAERLTAQKTPDLAPIVQAIVNRGGWSNGNAMVFILVYVSGAGQRALVTWDHATLAEPTLTVRYTT